MKKIIPSLFLLALCAPAFSQGFLNKIKSKINTSIEKPAQASQPATSQQNGGNFTDPAQYGSIIYTFSKDDITKHMGGDGGAFDLWFQNVSTANNQLKFQMVDYDQVYDYTGGKLVNIGAKTTQHENDQRNGSEYDLMSKDFSQMDMQNAVLKKGTHVSSGIVPGKPLQTLTFNGKVIGNYMMYALAHNADSSVVAVAGSTMGQGGMTSNLTLSTGQTISLPSGVGDQVYVSPDGKLAAAFMMVGVKPGEPNVYVTNGTKTTFKMDAAAGLVWLRNSGNLFSVSGDHKTIYRNGEVYHTFDEQFESDPKTIFIGKDDKNMGWVGNHAIKFSDGTVFENGESPHKITIDGKEQVIFFAVNVTTGVVYLCHHDL